MLENSNKLSNLIWIDLEMTGLNPDFNHILEIAMVITDPNLNIISEPFNQIIYQPAENLVNMVDFVKNMHIKNGLLQTLTQGLDI
ncbi:MAG: exonuclease domain-containing protein, partial [Gammaproteobacteria bacterium]